MHQPKQRPHKVADDPKGESAGGATAPGACDCQHHWHPYSRRHRRSRPGAVDETRPSFIAERLASLLDDNRLSIIARRYGIKQAKGTDSLGKLFVAYLPRAEESVLRSVLVETTILYMSTRLNPAQVLQEAATLYKVDTNAIALKVKQEFAAKEKSKKTPKTVSQAKKAA